MAEQLLIQPPSRFDEGSYKAFHRELNQRLAQIARTLERLQTKPTLKGVLDAGKNRLSNIGRAQADNDALPLWQLKEELDDLRREFYDELTSSGGKDSTEDDTSSGGGGGGGGVTLEGAGDPPQVAFWDTTTSLAGDGNFLWRATERNIVVGSQPAAWPRSASEVGYTVGAQGTDRPIVQLWSAGTGNPPGLFWLASRGTLALLATDGLGTWSGFGHDGNDYTDAVASIAFGAEENFSPAAWGSNIRFFTTNLGATAQTEKVSIAANGRVTTTIDILVNPTASGTGTVFGSTGVAGNLDLQHSTTLDYNNAGAGFIRLHGRVRNTDVFTATQVGGIMHSLAPTVTVTVDGAAPRGWSYGPSITGALNTVAVGETGLGGACLGFDAAGTVTKTAAGTDLVNSLCKFQGFETRYTWQYNNAAVGGTQIVGGFQSAIMVRNAGAGAATIDLVYGFGWSPFTGQPNPDAGGTRPSIVPVSGAGTTINRLATFWSPDQGYAGTVNELYQFYGENQTDAVVTRAAAFRSRMAAAATKFGLYLDGGAESVSLGGMSFGDLTKPGTDLHIRTAKRAWIGDTLSYSPSVAVWNLLTLNDDSNAGGQNTINVLNAGTVRGIIMSGHCNYAAGNPSGGAFNGFFVSTIFNPGANARVFSNFNLFNWNGTVGSSGFTGVTAGGIRFGNNQPVIGDLVGTGDITVTRQTAIESGGSLLEPAGGVVTVTDWNAIHFNPPAILGTPILTRLVCIDIENYGAVGTAQATVWAKGGMPMCHEGPAIFGALQTGAPVAPSAVVHAQVSTALTNGVLGAEVFRAESVATNDDPNYRMFHCRVPTTDATVTTLGAFTIPASTTVLIEARVVARRTGGAAGTAEDAAGYIVIACVKNVAGTATLVTAGATASPTVTFGNNDQAAWTATIDVNGATARVRVAGAASNNITWHATVIVQNVGT